MTREFEFHQRNRDLLACLHVDLQDYRDRRASRFGLGRPVLGRQNDSGRIVLPR
jgi:hypothetical protein